MSRFSDLKFLLGWVLGTILFILLLGTMLQDWYWACVLGVLWGVYMFQVMPKILARQAERHKSKSGEGK
jgi:hypothetical protein